MMTRNEMIEHLQAQECRVVFKKLDGEERDMTCTLMETVLPKATKDPLSQKKVRAVNEAVVVAWDVNKDAFRSFRVENVVSFS
jgi:hypothetical protein|tara:strand:+ start:113 stop:361 length:249 start_codon:yes stop_codon:yes gene_type:complete